jgi:hypothetical protein
VTFRVAIKVAAAVATRPSLWSTAVRQWKRTTPRRWWRSAPFLPVPRRDYIEFRLVTQYGSTGHPPAPADVLNYLSWCKRQRRPG